MLSPLAGSLGPLGVPSPVAAGGTFDPLTLTGLRAWYKADAGTYQTVGGSAATANSDPVGEWRDQSGNSFHVSNTGTARPTLLLATQNGLPVISFDGINDLLSGAHAVITQGTLTILVAYQARKPGGFPGVVDMAPTGAPRRELYEDSSGLHSFRGGGGGDIVNSSYTSGTFLVATALFNGASSSLQVNAGTPVTGTHGTDSTSVTTIYVGADGSGNTTARYFGEIIICNGALGTSEREAARDYLRTRWGTA